MNPRLELSGNILKFTGPVLALAAFVSGYSYGGAYVKKDDNQPAQNRYEKIKMARFVLTIVLPILAKLGEIGYNHMYKKSTKSTLAFKLVQLFCPVVMAYTIPNSRDNRDEASRSFIAIVVAVYTIGGCVFIGKQESEIKKAISPWKQMLEGL